jgi:hypothetical protein
VLLECATEVLIVDFLHSRSDLPRQIAAWGALKNNESDKGWRHANTLQARSLCQVHAEPIAASLISPCHLGRSVSEVFLGHCQVVDVASVHA